MSGDTRYIETTEGTAGMPSPPAKAVGSRHVDALDGFRGCAVLLVVAHHFLPHAGLGYFALLGSIGWSGVDAFLVLSAYLITSILYRQRGSEHFFQRFYLRRALRLFPLYYFILLVMLALTPILHLHWRLGDLPFFLYATNIVLPWDQSLGGLGPFNFRHLWTLALEEQFYLIWPWFLGSRLSRAALVKVCWGGMAAALCLRLWLVHIHFNDWAIYESLPTRMDSLLLGALLALSPLPSKRSAWIGFSVGMAGLLAVVLYGHTMWFTARPMMTFGYSLLALIYGSVLTMGLHADSFVHTALSARWLRFFGKYSYGIYLWHYIFSEQDHLLERWMAGFVPLKAAASLLSLGVSLLVATAIAMLSYRFIESPFLRIKRRFES